MSISLRAVDKDNWRQIIKLKLAEGQEKFVAPNWYSILEAQFEGGDARAIYLDDTPIGFTYYGFDPDDDRWWIARLMIAAEYQGKGYGRKAIELAIEDLRRDPACKDIYLGFEPENATARALYEKVGFVNTGEVLDGELVFRLPG